MPTSEFNDHKLLATAKLIVRQMREVSPTLLQQRLYIGPVRAATLLYQIQCEGDVSASLLPSRWTVNKQT
jgi:hypothetical protein